MISKNMLIVTKLIMLFYYLTLNNDCTNLSEGFRNGPIRKLAYLYIFCPYQILNYLLKYIFICMLIEYYVDFVLLQVRVL